MLCRSGFRFAVRERGQRAAAAKKFGRVACGLMKALPASRDNGEAKAPTKAPAELEVTQGGNGHVGKLMKPVTVARTTAAA